MEESYLTSSPSSSMDRQIVHFSSVSDSSPSSCSALPSCGLLCSQVKDIIWLGLDFLMLSPAWVVAQRQIRASSLSQILQLGEVSPAKKAIEERMHHHAAGQHVPSGWWQCLKKQPVLCCPNTAPHHLHHPP